MMVRDPFVTAVGAGIGARTADVTVKVTLVLLLQVKSNPFNCSKISGFSLN